VRTLREVGGLLLAGAVLSAIGLLVSGNASPQVFQALADTVRRQPRMIAWDDARVRAAEDGGLLVVDARPAGAFADGHPAGALSMPFAERHERLPELPAGRVVEAVLVVGAADRPEEARELARWLANLWGLERVGWFPAGWQGWQAAGLPEAER